jgi:hypothetical protein
VCICNILLFAAFSFRKSSSAKVTTALFVCTVLSLTYFAFSPLTIAKESSANRISYDDIKRKIIAIAIPTKRSKGGTLRHTHEAGSFIKF